MTAPRPAHGRASTGIIAMAFSALAAAGTGTASATPVETGPRPPIDVAAPAAVRTATFAVG